MYFKIMQYGYIVENNNEEWINAIEKLIKNKKLRLQMGEDGFDYILKNFSTKVTAKKIIDILKESI